MTRCRSAATRRPCGFSLPEVLVGVSVLLIVLGGVFQFLRSSLNATRLTAVMARLDQESSRALETVVTELVQAGTGTFAATPPDFATTVSYQRAVGFAAGAVVWGDPSQLGFEQDPRDPDDGADNNGNGLVDEGRIVLRRNPGAAGERVLVLVSGVAEFLEGEIGGNLIDDNGNGLVDEPGFFLVFEDGITAHLTLQRPGLDGQVLVRTLETSVAPRN